NVTGVQTCALPISGIELNELLVRMLAAALRWNGGNRSFQDFQQCLLYTFARDVTRYGRIVGLAGNLIYFINVDDSAACTLHVKISCLKQLKQNVFDIFTDITSLSQRSRISNRERYIQHPREGLREVCLAGTSWTKHQDIGLGNLNFLILVVLATAGSSCGLSFLSFNA